MGCTAREWIQVYFNQMKCMQEGNEQLDRVDGVITVLRPKVKSDRLNLVLKLRGGRVRKNETEEGGLRVGPPQVQRGEYSSLTSPAELHCLCQSFFRIAGYVTMCGIVTYSKCKSSHTEYHPGMSIL